VFLGNILSLLNGHLNQELNTLHNKNPPLAGTSIYPLRKQGDAPYSVSEDNLGAAIYIPELFKYGTNGKIPVILVPGTAIPAGMTYYFNFGKLASAMLESDIVWVNIPASSLADVQVTSEYITASRQRPIQICCCHRLVAG
jgi:hypothetical protein